MVGQSGMRRRAIQASAVIMLCAATVTAASAAASVTNRDEKDHKITIIEGEKKQDFTLKPNQALEGICAGGCVLRLNDSDDDEYQLEPTDVVSIEEGYLYYDNAEAEDVKPEEPKKK
jgi:NADH:ubiquinone oxidoreductase subunit E